MKHLRGRTWRVLAVVSSLLLFSGATCSGIAESGELLLLDTYQRVYRPDFEQEFGWVDLPNWRVRANVPYNEDVDLALRVEVTDSGVHIGDRASLDPENAFYLTGIESSSFAVSSGFEAVALFDIHEIEGETALILGARLMATNGERYEIDLKLSADWTVVCWGVSYQVHTWEWKCDPGQRYVGQGVRELRLRYTSEDRRVAAYVDLIPVASFQLPVQSMTPVRRCAFQVHAASEGEYRFSVTLLDMLIGLDPLGTT